MRNRRIQHGRAALYAAAFLMDLGTYSGYVALFWFVQDRMAAGLTTQGLLALLLLTAYLVLCPVFGRVARRRRWRLAFVVAGPLTIAGGYVLVSASTAVWHLAALTAALATGRALFWPALQAEIGGLASGRVLGRRVGVFNITWSVGVALAPALAGWAYAVNPVLPFRIATGAGLLIVALLAVYARFGRAEESALDPERAGPSDGNGASRGPAAPVAAAAAVTFVWLAWIANFVGYANLDVAHTLFQQLGRAEHLADPLTGRLIAVLGTARTATFVVLFLSHGWVHRRWVLFMGPAAMLAGGGLLSLPLGGAAGSAALPAGMALVGIGAGVAYATSLFYSVEASRHHRVTTGHHEGIRAAGGVAGLLLAGQVAPWLTQVHPRSPFYACAALTAVCLLAQIVIASRSPSGRG